MNDIWLMICLTAVITFDSIIINHKIDRTFSINNQPKRFEIKIIKTNGEGLIIGSINSIKYTSKFIEINQTITDKRSDITIVADRDVKILNSDIARYEISRGE